MKRIVAIIIVVMLAAGILSSCAGNSTNFENTAINVMLVDGAPLLSMAHMMSDEFQGVSGYDISFTMTNDSDALVAALLNGEPDFAVAPINVAAMMYNNGSGYRLAAVTTWGIIHIVSDRDVTTLEELRGNTVVAFARSGTPGITLRAVLRQNNIDFVEPDSTDFTPDPDKVSIVYLTAASDVRDAIATGMVIGGEAASFGLMTEPAATAISGFAGNAGRPGFSPRLNLQTQWARNNDGEIFPQAALIFHERLLAHNEDFVNDFIAAAEQSSAYANSSPGEAGDLAVSLGSIAIPNGAIVETVHSAGRLPIDFTRAADARSAVNTFLQTIFDENAGIIGGAVPSDDFYYAGF